MEWIYTIILTDFVDSCSSFEKKLYRCPSRSGHHSTGKINSHYPYSQNATADRRDTKGENNTA